MSAWAIFSMLGFYPDCPGSMSYGLTTPTFDKVTIHLDTKYYKNPTLVIETRPVDEHTNRQRIYFDEFQIGNKLYKNTYRINHERAEECWQDHLLHEACRWYARDYGGLIRVRVSNILQERP